jgi:tyrosine decarboxylase/aspartate 1-decarboxylase
MNLREAKILSRIEMCLKKERKISERRVLGRAWAPQDPFSVAVYGYVGRHNFNNILMHQRGKLPTKKLNRAYTGTFNFSRDIERELIAKITVLLRLSFTSVAGYVTSGGTEGNIYAMWSARNWANATTPAGQKTLWIIPQLAHYSVAKAINILGLDESTSKHRITYAPFDHEYRTNSDAILALLLSHQKKSPKAACVIVLTAVTTECGTIDSIQEVAQYVVKNNLKNVHIHVDAAFGGLTLPFTKKYKNTFSSPAISSVSIDFHKTFGGPIGSGLVLINHIREQYAQIHAPYLRDSSDFTLSGSRSGIAAIQNWAILESKGIRTMGAEYNRARELTEWLYLKLSAINAFNFVYDPELNYLVFHSNFLNDRERQSLEKLLYEYSITASMVSRDGEVPIKMYKIIVSHTVPKEVLRVFVSEIKTWSLHNLKSV